MRDFPSFPPIDPGMLTTIDFEGVDALDCSVLEIMTTGAAEGTEDGEEDKGKGGEEEEFVFPLFERFDSETNSWISCC